MGINHTPTTTSEHPFSIAHNVMQKDVEIIESTLCMALIFSIVEIPEVMGEWFISLLLKSCKKSL